MKHIKKFNNLSEYQGFIEGGIEPHVALIITESGKVLKYKRKKIKPLNQIIGIYIGTKNSNTRLLGRYFDISQIDKMYIDNVEITPSRSYSLTDNEHIVKYIMKNNLNNCSYMFDDCNKLTSLDLSSFDTSKVTDMHSMFSGCFSLTTLDLSSFDVSNITNMATTFENCVLLTDLNPFYNWKQGVIHLFTSPITPLAVHQLIERSMSASDGAEARTLFLSSTTKTEWENSEYHEQDLALLPLKNITVA